MSPHPMQQQIYHQHQCEHQHPQYSYHQVPAMNKMHHTGHTHRQVAMKINNNGYYDGSGNNFFNLPNGGGMGRNVDTENVCEQEEDCAIAVSNIHRNPTTHPHNSSMKKEGHAISTASSIHHNQPTTCTNGNGNMTHDEAIQLCTLMDSPGKIDHGCSEHGVEASRPPVITNDTLLQEMPSFDFGDHHSLFSDNGNCDSTSQELSNDDLLDQDEYQEYNIMDLIRGDHPLDLVSGLPGISLV